MKTKWLIRSCILIGSFVFLSGCAVTYKGCCPTVNETYRTPCGGYTCDDQDLISPQGTTEYCRTYYCMDKCPKPTYTYHCKRYTCCADYWRE